MFYKDKYLSLSFLKKIDPACFWIAGFAGVTAVLGREK